MTDYIVHASGADNQVRIFAASTRDLVEKAREIHNTSPVATAALGRLLTAGAMMGSMMKGEKDLLTLQIQCSGPIGGLTVTAKSDGTVKGYVNNPDVMLPPNSKGKLDVGGALDLGVLSVIKDMGMKEPYVGHTVKQAGGFILQLMPFTDDAVIDKLEENVKKLPSVTTMLEEGETPEGMIRRVLDGFDIEFYEETPTGYVCDCSRERVERAIVSIGKKEIQDMIDDQKPIEVNCHFCGKHYEFNVDELKNLLKKAVRA